MAHQHWDMYFHLEGSNIPLEVIDLGDAWAGETVSKQVYIKNNEEQPVFDVVYMPDEDEVQVSGPSTIASRESLPVKVMWSPSMTSVGLKTNIYVMGIIRYSP